MKETLITFETAKLAKEKWFFDKTIYGEVRLSQYNFYDDNGVLRKIDEAFELTKYFDLKNCCNAPTQSLLQKWLREVHNIHVSIVEGFQDGKIYYEAWVNIFKNKKFEEQHFDLEMYSDKYEEALEVGLQEALKIIPTE